MQEYAVAIIGAGPAGVLAAIELSRNTGLKVLLLEKMKRLHDSREVANGFMGGSSRSDVKLFLDPGFGGEISNPHIIPDLLATLEQFGPKQIKVSKQHLPVKMVQAIQAHDVIVDQPTTAIVGTEHLAAIEKAMYTYLLKRVDFRSNCAVSKIEDHSNGFKLTTNAGEFKAKYCIVAGGRGANHWLASQTNLNISHESPNYDLGVRLEFPHASLKEYTDKSTNFRLRFGPYRTTAISSCGTVELENVYDIKTTNGRTMSGRATSNSNFAILKTVECSKPMDELFRAVQIVNVLADGQLLKESPTKLLEGTSQLCCLPEFASLQDGITKLFEIWPKLKSRCALYAPEARLNVAKIKINAHMETDHPGLYVCGDVSGRSKSFVQAACAGLLAARNIMCHENNPLEF